MIVPDDKLSLAIGKGGQNVRLAAKLTNWKIDVKSESKANQENNLTSNHTDVDDIGDIFSGTEDISLDSWRIYVSTKNMYNLLGKRR